MMSALRFLSLLLLFASAVYGTSVCGISGFSDGDKDAIVNSHNALRSSIAKGTYVARTDKKQPATNMQKMKWDCSLEKSAQAYANSCPTGHSGSAGVGENLYWSYSSAPLSTAGKGLDASNAWQNEFQQFGWPSNQLTYQLFNSGIGHATQMAWWNSNRIGCGVKLCPSTIKGYPYEVAVVCQYQPQGNIINTNIYNSGTTCSACAAGMVCETSTGLCV